MRFALIAVLLVSLFVGCKKSDKLSDSCSAGATTVRQIVDQQAIIKITSPNAPAYLVETGSIDGKLIPCNLPAGFYQNDLLVVISGDVKQTTPLLPEPCCSNNFVITKITR